MKYAKAAIFTALTLIMMIVIFIFSAQPADESSAMSSPLAEAAVDLLYPSFETMPSDVQTDLLDTWSHIIRKTAHFCEYALLGALILLSLGSIRSIKTELGALDAARRSLLPLAAFAIGALYAASDELHQRFVEGRSGQLSDVLLDSAGVMAGILLIFLAGLIKDARRKRSAGAGR